MLRAIREFAHHTGFKTAADISADGVNSYAGKMRDDGSAGCTVHYHLTAIKAFTKWLTAHHKLPRDPLSSVRKPNPKTGRRRERRMLLPEEWRRLEAATLARRVRYGMAAEERLLLYRTAIQTGLRSNELRSLTRGRLHLDSTQPYITCKAGSTKNRKDAKQYIHADLATDLAAHINTKAPKAPVFGLPHESNVARMLRADMAEARKQWLAEAKDDPQEYARREEDDFLADTNHEGEILDFHCLRHSTGAWLAQAGAHPKTVQTVMRHGSITLTMDCYGHLFPGAEADAVGKLRRMLTDPADAPEALRATGTDHAATEVAQRQAQHIGRDKGRQRAMACEGPDEGPAHKESPKPLRIADLGDGLRQDAANYQANRKPPKKCSPSISNRRAAGALDSSAH